MQDRHQHSTLLLTVITQTASLHQEIDTLRLGNPGLAYGFCATLKQGIDLDVRHKTPLLPSFFSLSSSHCSLLSSLLSTTPHLCLAAASLPTRPNHPSRGIFSNLAARLEELDCFAMVPNSLVRQVLLIYALLDFYPHCKYCKKPG
jgi:hypothetical protein